MHNMSEGNLQGSNLNEKIDSTNGLDGPFEETFDKEDIIESIADLEKSAQDKKNKDFAQKYASQIDNNQNLEIRNLNDNINEAEFKIYQSNNLSEEFQDFLEVPKISGVSTKMPAGSYFPKELLIERNQKVTIQDNIIDKHQRTTILTNYDTDGNINSIEILCKCGEKTIINLEFEPESENNKFKQLTDKNNKSDD